MTTETRRVLIKILVAIKQLECPFDDPPDYLGCHILNIVLDEYGAPHDSITSWNREQFFEHWKTATCSEEGIGEFLNWVTLQLDPQLN